MHGMAAAILRQVCKGTALHYEVFTRPFVGWSTMTVINYSITCMVDRFLHSCVEKKKRWVLDPKFAGTLAALGREYLYFFGEPALDFTSASSPNKKLKTQRVDVHGV